MYYYLLWLIQIRRRRLARLQGNTSTPPSQNENNGGASPGVQGQAVTVSTPAAPATGTINHPTSRQPELSPPSQFHNFYFFLPCDKILHGSKLRKCFKGQLHEDYMVKFVSERLENIVGKEERAFFSLFICPKGRIMLYPQLSVSNFLCGQLLLQFPSEFF